MNMDPAEIPANTITAHRITVGALVAGIVTFVITIVVVHTQIPVLMPDLSFLTYLGWGMLAIMVALNFFVLPMIDANARKAIPRSTSSVKPWMDAWGSRTITGCALIESAAFLCLIGALLDGEMLGLAGGVSGAVIMLLMHWPTEYKIRNYIDRQRQLAELEGSG